MSTFPVDVSSLHQVMPAHKDSLVMRLTKTMRHTKGLVTGWKENLVEQIQYKTIPVQISSPNVQSSFELVEASGSSRHTTPVHKHDARFS